MRNFVAVVAHQDRDVFLNAVHHVVLVSAHASSA
jgi:hypothetical protein